MRKASEKFSRLTFFTPYDCMTTASTFPLSIGCAAGFSGDRVDAAGPVVDSLIARCAAHPGQRASLIFETLAERTWHWPSCAAAPIRSLASSSCSTTCCGSVAAQIMVVNPGLPVKDVNEFIALAKCRPGKLSFGSGSSSSRVAGEMFKQLTGTYILNTPYKSNPPAVTDLLGGQIDRMITDLVTGMPQVEGAYSSGAAGFYQCTETEIFTNKPGGARQVPGRRVSQGGRIIEAVASRPRNAPPERVRPHHGAIPGAIDKVALNSGIHWR